MLRYTNFSEVLVNGKPSIFASFYMSKWSPYFSQSLKSKRTDNLLFVLWDSDFFFVLSVCSEKNIIFGTLFLLSYNFKNSSNFFALLLMVLNCSFFISSEAFSHLTIIRTSSKTIKPIANAIKFLENPGSIILRCIFWQRVIFERILVGC